MGFEILRFENVSEDFKCPICQDILEDPLQIATCEHMFCCLCITKWIEQHASCPVDRNPIMESQLRETSRFFRNQYKRLRIKCKFNIHGCEEIVEIETIMSHEINCLLNPDLLVECDRGCGEALRAVDRVAHNCFIDLRSAVRELHTKLNIQNEEICSLKQTIAKLEMKSNACEELKVLIISLKRRGAIKSTQVENIMLIVDRSIFCSSGPYDDAAKSINYGTTISAPTIHAVILELLKSKLIPNAKVLDIGSGSGYLSFCMSIMVGVKGKVIGIDHVRQLTDQSNEILRQHFTFLKSSQLKFVTADRRGGYQNESPYDVINYGGAVDEVPQIVIDQLKPNGRILVPLRNSDSQKLVTIDKSPLGVITKREHVSVIFGSIGNLESQL